LSGRRFFAGSLKQSRTEEQKQRKLLEARRLASKVVLLDRDGVINRRIPNSYVTSWNQFVLLPGVLEGLRRLTVAGYSILVVSNQAAVGKGHMTSSALRQITRRFIQKVRAHGGSIRGVYYCLHRKEARCMCRKPRAGLLLQAQADHHFSFAETYLIGDSVSDLMAARRAGCPMIMIKANAASLTKAWTVQPDIVVPDFRAAVDAILDGGPS
jgi:D-glycero-D-manno-heptose 1,7-bisphosphate phosphatase